MLDKYTSLYLEPHESDENSAFKHPKLYGRGAFFYKNNDCIGAIINKFSSSKDVKNHIEGSVNGYILAWNDQKYNREQIAISTEQERIPDLIKWWKKIEQQYSLSFVLNSAQKEGFYVNTK